MSGRTRSALSGLIVILLVPAAQAGELETLLEWMTGSFGSGAQAAADSSYHDIRLEMVPIWTDRDDGPWLYVEQAAAAALERPYRQRVYRVTEPVEGRFASEVFELPEPLRFAGAWRDPAAFDALAPDSLSRREGCAVHLLRADDGTFTGSTEGPGCQSSLRGAAYATSIVTIGPERIESWDRGFDADGNQVWGAEKGPYLFLRRP
jgi:hypothetical protein